MFKQVLFFALTAQPRLDSEIDVHNFEAVDRLIFASAAGILPQSLRSFPASMRQVTLEMIIQKASRSSPQRTKEVRILPPTPILLFPLTDEEPRSNGSSIAYVHEVFSSGAGRALLWTVDETKMLRPLIIHESGKIIESKFRMKVTRAQAKKFQERPLIHRVFLGKNFEDVWFLIRGLHKNPLLLDHRGRAIWIVDFEEPLLGRKGPKIETDSNMDWNYFLQMGYVDWHKVRRGIREGASSIRWPEIYTDHSKYLKHLVRACQRKR